MPETKGAYQFKAEVKQLLDILVHSLYTNRDIFLRELVSNASDALDKARLAASQSGDASPAAQEIRITSDKDKKTLTVTDTGVGMTRDELIANLGTIAHSGTADFLKQASEGKEGLDGLIGRFGVGFYSVYMVAGEVVVRTRSMAPGSPSLEWKSDGQGEYEITELSGELPQGTSVEVHLKEDLPRDFTDPATLKDIIKRHSNFISFPILVGEERVNTVPALWREPKFNVKKEQYAEFYKFLTYDHEEPFETLHVTVDAPVQFASLLFVPKKDADVFGMNRETWGLDLYVRRVLIKHQDKDLLPQYLSFVKGVVDTEDLPLNISRETLQENIVLKKIATTLTKQVLSHLEKVATDDEARYNEFWTEHAKVFKLGYSDYPNREKFAALVRFNASSHEDDKGLTSLDAYITRAKTGQKRIYYAFGPSREAVRLNPHLEIFRRKGLEVLYLYEPIDEFVVDSVHSYKEFEIQAAEHVQPEDLKDFPDLEEAKTDKPEALSADQAKDFDGLMARMKEILGDKVTEVKASARLSDSPCCLVNPDGHTTSSMDKIMRVITKDSSIPKKVLEVNPDHALLRNLLAVYEKSPQDEFLRLSTEQLFESSLLLEGYLSDPHALVGRLQDLLTRAGGWYVERDK